MKPPSQRSARCLFFLVVFLFISFAHTAVALEETNVAPAARTQPAQALIYDDGTAELGGVQQLEGDSVALRFTPAVYPFYLQRVSVNITNYGSIPTEPLELRVYADSNGRPGSLVAGGITIAGPLTAYDENVWVDADLSSYRIAIPSGSFFVAVFWQNSWWSPGLGVDVSSPNELRTWVYEEGTWSRLPDLYPWAYEHQAMIRAYGSKYAASAPLLLQKVFYDDGVADRAGVQQVPHDMVALQVTPPSTPFYIQRVSVNLMNYPGNSHDPAELNIYADNNGMPGQLLLGGVPFVDSPMRENGNMWLDLDVSSYNIVIPEGDFYVAVEWLAPLSPALGIDRSEPNQLRTWVYEGGQWSLLAEKFDWAYEDQAMIRVLGSLYSAAPLAQAGYDDGLWDRAGVQQEPGDAVALRITPTSYPFHLEGIAMNLVNRDLYLTNELELQIYDGNNGVPGSLLLQGKLVYPTPLPVDGNVWVYTDVSEHEIVITEGDIFVAAEWRHPWSPALGIDRSNPNEFRTWVREGGQWSLLAALYYPWAYEDQAMIRAFGSSGYDPLTINLTAPANGSILSAAPRFSWTASGGSRNIYAVDLSLSASFANYWSTYENLKTPLSGTSWQMPAQVWNQIAHGKTVYWRARGVDLDKKPLVVVPSRQAWSFTKQ